MKSLVPLLCMLGLVAMSAVPCVKYQCDNVTAAPFCGKIESKDEELTVWLKGCPEKKVCTLRLEMGQDDVCGDYYTAALRYPGEFCKNDTECFSNKCTEKKCVGTPKDGTCSSDVDCDVALYCDKTSLKCLDAGKENAACDSAKCASPFVCNGTHCVKMGLLDNGSPSTVPALCKSLYVLGGKCSEGPKLDGLKKDKIEPLPCPAEGCKYNVLGSSYTQNCQCGRLSQGEEFCSPGKGDLDLAPYLTYVQKGNLCHITKGPLCLTKDIKEMSEDYLNAVLTYTKMTKWVAIHKNDECVKKTINSEYYDAFDALNSDDDEDKFGLYLFLGIAIGAVVVIGALLLVIYLKRRKGDEGDETTGGNTKD